DSEGIADEIILKQAENMYCAMVKKMYQSGNNENTATEEPTEEPTTGQPTTEQPVTEQPATAKKSQCITSLKAGYTKIYGMSPFYLKAKTNGDGRLSYKSSNTRVVAVSSSGRVTIKGVGKAVITISASETDAYKSGLKKVIIKVKPKRTANLKLSSQRKGKLKISWSKDKRVSGYEIVVATNRNFTKNRKRYNIKNYKTASKILNKLKSGKIYYVKVRSYKKINGELLWGAYSRIKKVKIK
ncbi:MAG: hypothetical protein ACI4EF_04205, partial [Coprococcus sp.]